MIRPLRPWLLVLGLALAAPARAEGCPQAVPSQALVEALEGAEAAYQDLDLPQFQAKLDEAGNTLPCVSEVLSRPLIARYHRDVALRAFLAREMKRVPQAFSAARAIEPDYALPQSLVPAEHPLRQMYNVQVDPGPPMPMPAPADGYLLVDGREATDRPHDLPVVLQWVSGTGQVRLSAYLWPETPTPDWPLASPPPPTAARLWERGTTAQRALAIGSGTGLALGLVSYSVALVNHARFNNMATPPDDLSDLATRTNVGQGLALGGLGLAAAAGAGLLVTVVWK